MIIAIDGPAGSGKSTTARAVAQRIGGLYLDTGAMYRAVALRFLQSGTSPTVSEAEGLMAGLGLHVEPDTDGNRLFLGETDVTALIRTPEVSRMASAVSALGPVRAALMAAQQRIARTHAGQGLDVILDGRDMGTVVFPDADLKVFMVAGLDERARRRHTELLRKGASVSMEDVRADIARRDAQDSTRALAPLRKAEDAFELDTTSLTFEEQVERITTWIEQKRAGTLFADAESCT